jgi:hypothetical protein
MNADAIDELGEFAFRYDGVVGSIPIRGTSYLAITRLASRAPLAR